MKTLVAVVALAFGFPGCETRPPVVKHDGGPLVVYEHGGGIAAQPRRLVIERDGRAKLTVVTGADESHRAFRLTGPELDDVERALEDAAGAEQPKPTGCADCFTFSITADGIDVDLDQVSIDDAPEPVGRLVTLLEGLSSP
ncbi:MAG: hypothetical protein QOI80_1730 [Solirubrobacteraceae bacterium]|jgi:hypothetical protein|nr:hypothetical protein [Solirubrobacteraceae bacterium]